MERTGLRGRQSKKAPVGIILLLMSMIIPAFTISDEKRCPDGDYVTDAGICCNKCNSGFKLVDVCHAPGHRSNCTRCPSGQYLDQMNSFRNCRRCRTCKERYTEQQSPCTSERNTICRCIKGFYKFEIDSVKSNCLPCTSCKHDEIMKEKCTPNSDTVCGCKENYVRVQGKCEPCTNCTSECKVKCPTTPMYTQRPSKSDIPPNQLLINVICGAVAGLFLLLVLVVFITYMSTKRHFKKKIQTQSSEPSHASFDTCKEVLITEEPSHNITVTATVQSPACEQEQCNLPDCVPLEIKIPDLIYMVLDVVPVLQVKQLVRSLGVRDTEIEQAEMDHRSCREAHYQMLRMWAERGSLAVGGGQGGMLHRPLLEELLDKLRQMLLGRAAEELETKYGIQ